MSLKLREAAKKFFFSELATKRGGGGKGRATKKNELFLKLEIFAFVAGQLKMTFFSATLRHFGFFICKINYLKITLFINYFNLHDNK